ncbi:MAG: DUF366 family protein [Methylotenera sp.]|nr:DUF366 family protein [Oligoflexia bacterium]
MIFATEFSEKERIYTGVELRPHFLLSEMNLKGSGIGAFIGPCQVKTEHLVDWEDRLVNDHIQAKQMVHFIGEFFGASLGECVFAQRLLMATMAQEINLRLHANAKSISKADFVVREGDDLFIHGRKMSVSIVTSSPVSQLLHAGVNIDPAGAPVAAIGLKELGIPEVEWVHAVLKSFAEEWESIEWACTKVRPVM